MDMQPSMSSSSFGGVESAPVVPPKPQKNVKFFLFGFIGLVILVLILILGVGVYRVYAKAGQDRFSLAVATWLHLPAAKVNGQVISYTDYVTDLKAITKMRDYSRSTGGSAPGANYTDQQMSDQVILRLANNILVSAAAEKFGVSVSSSEAAALKAQVLQQFKTTADADTELMKRYGWNLETYSNRVIGPFLLQNKLAQKVQADESARAIIKAKAEGVLDQIKGGADFAALAKQYGEDGTAPKGGDLGYFTKGTMVPEFETVAFALKKGELNQQLVETQYGYHIIKVLDHKTEKVKDKTGKMVTQESVDAQHILFLYPSLEKYLDSMLKQANIHFYLRVHNPFTALMASSTTP